MNLSREVTRVHFALRHLEQPPLVRPAQLRLATDAVDTDQSTCPLALAAQSLPHGYGHRRMTDSILMSARCYG
jgi:hypothetical protein